VSAHSPAYVLAPSHSLSQHTPTHGAHVHISQDGAVKTPYTMQQLQRYIKFARTLTPRITLEAEKVMVQEYIKLRQNDASSLTKYVTLYSRQSVSLSN
jgi:DNA replicative helicase MCM subunit Mcm2 (Cdc46/Mcm family)